MRALACISRQQQGGRIYGPEVISPISIISSNRISSAHGTRNATQTLYTGRSLVAIPLFVFLCLVVLFPTSVHAGFFSSIAKLFSPDAAGAGELPPPVASVSLPLLGSRQVAQQTEETDADGKQKVDPDPSPLPVVQDSALVGFLNPLGTMSENGQDKIMVYLVQAGDTGRGIAGKFGISLNTLLWANDLKSASEIKVGDSLVILPVSGIQYEVRKGDTIDSIIKKFKPKGMTDEQDVLSFKADILSFNNLGVNEGLEAGSVILIPDGEIATPPAGPRQSRPGSGGGTRLSLPDFRGYYLRPVIGGRRSRGLHGYNGVDIANSCGLPTLASADGVVVIARISGWNGGYGKYVVLSHANGTQTLYAHLNTLMVAPGQRVDQGAQIGSIGSTGNSTGCHVHFEIRGARNPF